MRAYVIEYVMSVYHESIYHAHVSLFLGLHVMPGHVIHMCHQNTCHYSESYEHVVQIYHVLMSLACITNYFLKMSHEQMSLHASSGHVVLVHHENI